MQHPDTRVSHRGTVAAADLCARHPSVSSHSARRIAHLTTVDLSLRYLLCAQIDASIAQGDEVVGISASGPDVPFLEERGMRFIELAGSTRSMDPWADVRAARALWRILKVERPDVLHTHNPKPGLYGRVLGRMAGVPRVVHTTHGLYASPNDRRLRRVAIYGFEAIASRFSHVELVQNPEDYALMRRLRIAPRRKLRLLGNGVDLERFHPADEATRSTIRAELGLSADDIVVGLVARLVEEKGVPELIEAMELLGPPFRLLLVGPRDTEKPDAVGDGLLDRARAAGALLTGHRADVHRMYAAMDVFCLPSHREGFPRAAMEAAASGLPVVATDIRGCRQVVEPGRTGLLVRVSEAASLARALGTYADLTLRHQHGDAARAKAERDFDERAIVIAVLASYDANRVG